MVNKKRPLLRAPALVSCLPYKQVCDGVDAASKACSPGTIESAFFSGTGVD